MAASSRRKGVVGEREAASIWQAAGFAVRGLEAGGDHLILGANGAAIFEEVKRQERVRIPEWIAQCERDAPQGTVPVVAFRQSRGKWYAVLPLASLVELAQ